MEQTDQGHPIVETDMTLTPENAKSRGYAWCIDTIPSVFDALMLADFHESGYKFGKPKSDLYDVGLYEPLQKPQEKETEGTPLADVQSMK